MKPFIRELFGKLSGASGGLSDDASGREVKMVVGLGNPGREYSGTRHNIGFEVVDLFAERLGAQTGRKKFGGLFGEALAGDTTVLLLKPGRYMNKSGEVVAAAMNFYRLRPENLMVVTDDMALEPGVIRLRSKGSSGGHNGLKDIIEKLGTDNFARLRLGIGQSNLDDSADYVLSRPDREHEQLLEKAREKATDALICWMNEGIEQAMNVFNVK